MPDPQSDILTYLFALYGEARGEAAFKRLSSVLARCAGQLPGPRRRSLNERDAVMIT